MRWQYLVLTLLMAGAAHAELPSAPTTAVNQALASGSPTVIDLGARTCIPCKKMAPILESMSKEYQGKANVLFIDVHADQETARKLRVQMIPTQIFYNTLGKEVRRHTGFMDRADILKELKTAGLK
jgi:thioredoxin 1